MVTPALLEDLRHRVLVNPSDRQSLEVFADALLEVGDELGEHIREALSGEEPELGDDLEDRLLGRLRPSVARYKVVHGFLRRVSLSNTTVADFRRLIGVAEWEGVTAITLGLRRRPRDRPLPAAPVLALLRHQACRCVREVNQLGFDAFQALCDTELRYERVELVGLPYWGLNTPLARGSLEVRDLALEGPGQGYGQGGYGAVLAWLKTWGRSVFERIEVLRLGGGWRDDLNAVLTGAGAGLRQLSVGNWLATRAGPGWDVVYDLSLGSAGRSHLGFQFALAQLPLAVSELAGKLSRLTVRMPEMPEEQQRLVQEAAGTVPLSFEWQAPIEELESDDIPF